MVRELDWAALMRYGASFFCLEKLGRVKGVSNPEMVAGFRGDSLEVRHFAAPDAADSAASREPTHAQLPAVGVSALWTLLDPQERVRGIVAAERTPMAVTRNRVL